MKRLFGIILLSSICMISIAYAVEYPQFRSAISTTGITANFDTLYSKADRFTNIYDIKEHDNNHIIWIYKDTGNWAIVKDDGTLVVAGPSAFSLDIKKTLNSDLTRVKNLIISAGGRISELPSIYYSEDAHMYRIIKYDFNQDFYLNLDIPKCTLQKAMLTVSGLDYAEIDYYGRITKPGQHYLIDGKEVSGCDAQSCSVGFVSGASPVGVSCVPSSCDISSIYYYEYTNVGVIPVDITNKIVPGSHKILASGISDQHTMIIEAITLPSKDEILLYPDDITWTINETRSRSISELYPLILPTDNVNNMTNNSQENNKAIFDKIEFSSSNTSGSVENGGIYTIQCIKSGENTGWLVGLPNKGNVALAPTNASAGAKWKIIEAMPGVYYLNCLSDTIGSKWLDGEISNSSVVLAPTTNDPYLGTSWVIDEVKPGTYQFKLAEGYTSGPRWLEGQIDGSVSLASTSTDPESGISWQLFKQNYLPAAK